MGKTYPPPALRQLREQHVTEKSVGLSAAQLAHARARQQVECAERAREHEERCAVTERQRERQLLEDGAVRAADLQQGERYNARACARVMELVNRELAAKQQAAAACAEEQKALAALAVARAEAKALERHYDRLEAEQRRSAELAQDEAMLDRWTAAKYGPRRG